MAAPVTEEIHRLIEDGRLREDTRRERMRAVLAEAHLPHLPPRGARQRVRARDRVGRQREFVVTHLDDPTIERGLLRLNIEVTTAEGEPVPISMPWYVANPPVLVDDPAGDVVRLAPAEDPEEGPVEVHLREDPAAAWQRVLEDFLVEQAGG